MNGNARAYVTWAPSHSPWSPWVKPVLFAYMNPIWMPSFPAAPSGEEAPIEVPPATDRAALVVDLPGARSVRAGLSLASRGYRPVPLYNACPGPAALQDLGEIILALHRGTDLLSGIPLEADAPPVFLLDSRRMEGTPTRGSFDNRWMTFPQDFPSARFLRSRGIREAILLQDGTSLRRDLVHVLLRWSQDGLPLRMTSAAGGPAVPLHPTPPPWYRVAWHRALAIARLRRNSAGGFGARVPDPSEGGGGGGYGYRGFGGFG